MPLRWASSGRGGRAPALWRRSPAPTRIRPTRAASWPPCFTRAGWWCTACPSAASGCARALTPPQTWRRGCRNRGSWTGAAARLPSLGRSPNLAHKLPLRLHRLDVPRRSMPGGRGAASHAGCSPPGPRSRTRPGWRPRSNHDSRRAPRAVPEAPDRGSPRDGDVVRPLRPPTVAADAHAGGLPARGRALAPGA